MRAIPPCDFNLTKLPHRAKQRGFHVQIPKDFGSSGAAFTISAIPNSTYPKAPPRAPSFAVNAPLVQWAQGDRGDSPQNWLRIFGRNFASPSPPPPPAERILRDALRDALDKNAHEDLLRLAAQMRSVTDSGKNSVGPSLHLGDHIIKATNFSAFSAFFDIPEDFPAGVHTLKVSSPLAPGGPFPIEFFQSKRRPVASTWQIARSPPQPPLHQISVEHQPNR